MPKEEQMNLIKDLERKETEYMRLRRHKICVDDFELLTIIGRGAFGEVRDYSHLNKVICLLQILVVHLFLFHDLLISIFICIIFI